MTAKFQLQRQGYAAGITSPRVLTAIQAGTHRAIAVCFVEWAGPDEQKVVVKWTVIKDGESAGEFAATLLKRAALLYRAAPRSAPAIDFAVKQFAESGVEADRRIIDVSGDGTNNAGRPVTDARDEAVAAGVTINGLAIINQRPAGYFFAHTQPPGGSAELVQEQRHRRQWRVPAGGAGFHHLRRGDHQQAADRDCRARPPATLAPLRR